MERGGAPYMLGFVLPLFPLLRIRWRHVGPGVSGVTVLKYLSLVQILLCELATEKYGGTWCRIVYYTAARLSLLLFISMRATAVAIHRRHVGVSLFSPPS